MPPIAIPNLVNSAKPLVIIAARVLSPASAPSPIPVAMAIIFFKAPPNSQPITSEFVYTLNNPELKTSCNFEAIVLSTIAITAAAAFPKWISFAKFGPVKTPAGCPGIISSIISVMRILVLISKPFAKLIIGTQGLIYGFASIKTCLKT